MRLKQIGHQGDTQWFSVNKLPSDAEKIKNQFIASSERSGSFHALFGNYEMYQVKNGLAIDVKEDCILNHSLQNELDGVELTEVKILPKKDHRHSIIKKGIYLVGIQNRFDPMENLKKRVID